MLELPPGEPLNEAELIGTLGVGRTPYREALQRLVQHGLVVAKPYQSAMVAPLQATDIAHIVDVRIVLEVASARSAAERATRSDREAIARANDAYNNSIGLSDVRSIIQADAALHDAIAAATHNPYLRQAVTWNRDYGCRLWCLAVDRGDDFNTRRNAHDRLVAAIDGGDPDEAEAAMREHIGMFRSKLLKVL
jgi:DNA-binding GntR family transcriptional regulator